MENYKKQFAEFLVSAEALQFGEFTLKSGRVSPYFFNSSKFNTGPLIDQLGQYYASVIKQHAPDCSLVYGPAYNGIPLCVTVATALSKKLNRNIGYFFNRKEIKTHGDQGTLFHTVQSHQYTRKFSLTEFPNKVYGLDFGMAIS